MARIVTIIDKDLGWKKIQKELRQLDGTVSNVGLFGSGSSPKNNIAARGAVHELGIGNPKRPFMRNAFDKNSNKLYDYINKQYNLLKAKKLTVSRFVGLISEWLIGKIQEEIRKGEFIPLSWATVRRKGSSVILIHKGQMINSLTYKAGKK